MTLEERAAALSPAEIVAVLAENAALKQQNAWFKRQLFGRKSERRLLAADPQQLTLPYLSSSGDEATDLPPPLTETVKAYQRRLRGDREDGAVEESPLRFEPTVPMEVIRVANPETAGLAESEYEVISEKVTYRLAQRPGAYFVLKYVRPVIKRKATAVVSCPLAPPAVLERSLADVSLLAGLIIDKFRFHLPLYRQHQRLAADGIHLSRATLTQWVHRTAALLKPIYHALLSSILQSQVVAMDETPIKAGRQGQGKLHTGYFWPIYGDQDEIAFPYAASRAQAVVREALGQFCGVLLTDGYRVYERYAQTVNGVVHAQCWSHCRAYIPGADLARALGGTGRYDAGKLRYEIRPGANGPLTLNPGALRSIVEPNDQPRSIIAPNDRQLSPTLEPPDSGTGGKPGLGQAAAQNSVRLNLGGGDLMIEEEEHVMLRPGEPGFSLELLGRLLGGRARLDPSSGAWLLPPGGPGTPLAFR